MEIRKLIAAAALGTGAVFTSMAFAADDSKPKQSVGEYASDATVTTKVKAAFVADKQLSALEIAVETVRRHRKSIYRKLDVSSQTDLFSLFLNSMSCLGAAAGSDPLSIYMAPR